MPRTAEPQQFPVQLSPAFQNRDESGAGFTLRYSSRSDALNPSEDLILSRDPASSANSPQYTVRSTKKTQAPEFKGTAVPSRDVECVLVFNATTQAYEIHPVNFDLRVTPTHNAASARELTPTLAGTSAVTSASSNTASAGRSGPGTPTGPAGVPSASPMDTQSTSGNGSTISGTSGVKKRVNATKKEPSIMRKIRKKPLPSPASTAPSPLSTPTANTPQLGPSAGPSRGNSANFSSLPVTDDGLNDLANELENVLGEGSKETSPVKPGLSSGLTISNKDDETSSSEEE